MGRPIEQVCHILLWVIAFAALGRAESADERFLEGLRQRRLFSLAQTYCQRRLEDSQLSDRDRAQLVIELSRSYAQHALDCPPANRGRLWQRAGEVVADFERRYPHHPRRVLVRVQGSLVLLAQGELTRQETDVAAAGSGQLDTARKYIRQAITSLESLDAQIVRTLRQHRADPGQLSEGELLSLEKHVRYHLARAYRNQARLYPDDSPDRVNALTQAIQQLTPLAQLSLDNPLAWRSRTDEIVCYRLLKDYQTAQRKLRAVESAAPPAAIRLRSRAERLRLELARQNLREALRVVASGCVIAGQTSAELDVAHLETYVACWQAANRTGDDDQATGFQEKAIEMVHQIEQTHGAYWTRRAEMFLAHAAAGEGGAGNVDLLVRTAQHSYTRKQYDDAVAAFERAALKARQLDETDRAFQLFHTAARIEHDRGRRREALRRFRSLALTMPSHLKAGDAHLWALFNASQLVKKERPGSLEEYTELLTEHLQQWPDSLSADTARWWLARLREHQGAWQEAVDAYRHISAGSRHHEDAVRACGRCWIRRFDQLKQTDKPYEEEAAAAAGYFDEIILGPDRRLPERWSPTTLAAALAAARLRLFYAPNGFAAAERIISAALRRASDAPDHWRATARSLLVIALAGQERWGDARQRLQQVSQGSPDTLLQMLVALSELVPGARPQMRGQLARLQLEMVSLLAPRRDQLNQPDRLDFDRIHAAALADAGQRAEALQAYQRLAEENPQHGKIQEGYARLLLAGDRKETLTLARDRWREVLRKSRPKSERWYRAKYSVALAHYKLGERKRAADMIRLVQTLPPGLEATSMKDQFLKLLEMCQR